MEDCQLSDNQETSQSTDLIILDNMATVAPSSSEDESAEVAGGGGDLAAETSSGDHDAAGCEAPTGGWYRPGQRKKGRRGRGGKKKRSQKGKQRHNNTENIVERDEAEGGEVNVAAANTAKGAVAKKTNKSTQHPNNVRGQRRPIRAEEGSASGNVVPYVGRSGITSESSRGPNSNDSRLLRDRPRNWPRTQVPRRRAGMGRYSMGDDYDIVIVTISYPMSFMDFIMNRMASTRLLNDYDSD